jgi:hypothetical protein
MIISISCVKKKYLRRSSYQELIYFQKNYKWYQNSTIQLNMIPLSLILNGSVSTSNVSNIIQYFCSYKNKHEQCHSCRPYRVLAVMYNLELLGFWTLSIVRYLKNYRLHFGNWFCFRSQARGRHSVGFLRKSHLNQWSIDPKEYVSPPSPEDRNRFSFRNVVFPSFYNTVRWTKSKTMQF